MPRHALLGPGTATAPPLDSVEAEAGGRGWVLLKFDMLYNVVVVV